MLDSERGSSSPIPSGFCCDGVLMPATIKACSFFIVSSQISFLVLSPLRERSGPGIGVSVAVDVAGRIVTARQSDHAADIAGNLAHEREDIELHQVDHTGDGQDESDIILVLTENRDLG